MKHNEIAPEFRDAVTTQDYSPKTKIEGVKVIDLRLFSDDGGSFAELVRFNEDGSFESIPEFTPLQSSFSEVLPGAIKAFHLHHNQEDVWFVPPTSRLLVGLVDVRDGSATRGVRQRLVLGGGKAQLLYIPRNVAHGCANLGTQSATLLYFVNQKFSADNPDEHRLPHDIVGEDFWEITKG